MIGIRKKVAEPKKIETEQPQPKIVIIGGFPRAGTRQFCNLVNYVPGCNIQGEMDAGPYAHLAELVRETDRIHKGKTEGGGLIARKNYFDRRTEAVFESYRLFSKSRKNTRPNWDEVTITGLKKPLVELSYRHTKALFQPSHESVLHFYCLRRVYPNFNSLAGAFDYTVSHYIKRLSESIVGLQEMAEDDFFEVRPLFLDEFIKSDGPAWVQKNLYDPMGVSMPREEIERAIEKTRGSNRTPDEKRRAGTTRREANALSLDEGFMDKIQWLEDYFKVSLL
ncbi:hypothetical protein RA28_10820 [Ruegeria sp. ANG-S4]|uniref:hypothetical protein n=1 Tax=Ruegeria sp. ANG-S4 TaxID=1577904 RepID=UPI00057D6183|nr:hypothetical protein [Ruegeria sp. ANG-S4]KIC44990.1 hypothetical protein RA28_10820 [Ruegeria sp. ANG-S4]